jgi:Mrp family chromosome partitioning ATPase
MAVPVKNITNFPLYLRDSKGEVTKRTFRSILVDLSCHFPYSELTKLYRRIETALPEKHHRVIQFVSAYREEGASEIALETAITVARLIGQRVLFIDTTTSLAARRTRKLPGALAALETVLLAGSSPYDAIAQATGTELYFAMLCAHGNDNDGLAPIPLNALGRALESLRMNFDLIIIDSQAIMNDAFGMALAKLVDGSVIVIEAERTRAPVTVECKNLIEDSGGRVIGAVMSGRRKYIPDSLYRMLYQRAAA